MKKKSVFMGMIAISALVWMMAVPEGRWNRPI